MVEIWPGLNIGSESDYEQKVRHLDGWSVVHACKDPYHRQALGYSGRGAPKEHPEYLIARRNNRLILNLVDVADPAFIPKECVDAAIDFTSEALTGGRKVLIHCNQGGSRAPSIGLLYLIARTPCIGAQSFVDAEAEFRALYPAYAPARGVQEFARQRFLEYRALNSNNR
ncbi:phosphatase [Corallococcus sp. CA053C]|uniref:dual specificity protein phosphatase family protein n=1 Tax=Corallococcus sp. CA053C TaxID=2316732 RepID=UPI000EA36082|nr:dual specificity protein phosphatase family protein [Corallococcus sp. CA053C]RKH06112.1 phosphatase [Corallococcus sp. CA053C]